MNTQNIINKVEVTLAYVDDQYDIPELSDKIVFYTTSTNDEDIKNEAREQAEYLSYCNTCRVADFLGVREALSRDSEEGEGTRMSDEEFSYEVFPNCGLCEELAQKYDQITPLCEELFLVEKDGKKGYIKPDGRVAVPCIADEVFMIFDGLAYFKSDGKFGFYCIYTDKYYEPIYDEADNEDDESPVSVVLNGERGYVTEDGKFITEEQFHNGEYDSVVSGYTVD